MAFGRGNKGGNTGGGESTSSSSSDNVDNDPTSWIINNELANFLLMNTNEIKYMCMIGYTFLHGCKVFKKIGGNSSNEKKTFSAYKLITMILACTGGGILVPIFLNTIPVTIAIDAYPIAILVSFVIHTYFPILREVVELSPYFKALMVVFYETIRTYVVTLFVGLAASTIAPSQFSFPVFGPIICGTIGGCGGAFLPFDKGLAPIKDGLPPPVFTAFTGATFFHLFTHYTKNGNDTGIPFVDDVLDQLQIDAPKKGKVIVALWFILYTFYLNGIFSAMASAPIPPPPVVKVVGASTKAASTKAASVKTEKKKRK